MNRAPLQDSQGRIIRDLRISITDRCNFRCVYCLPETEEAANFYRTRFQSADKPQPQALAVKWQPKSQILSYEEITRIVRITAGMGVNKIRLTGGEPLLRRGVENLISNIRSIEGIEDLALTTNGFSFPERAAGLKEAGLGRVSISMDSLDRENFKKMTSRDGLDTVLESIRIAKEAGLGPVKINAVVIKDLNDHELEALARFANEQDISMRFIEFMPLDSKRAWLQELVVTGKQIRERLLNQFDLKPAEPNSPSETAKRWIFPDGRGEIGIIAPVSEPFCGHCNRIRLTADGRIRTCLFSLKEPDLKPLLREGGTDQQIEDELRRIILGKEPGHQIGKKDYIQPDRSMSCIGG